RDSKPAPTPIATSSNASSPRVPSSGFGQIISPHSTADDAPSKSDSASYPAPAAPDKADEHAFFGTTLSRYGLAPVQRDSVKDEEPVKGNIGSVLAIVFGLLVMAIIIGAIIFLMMAGSSQ
ncbi:MAG: hypothetical protein RBU37_03740, partial [Myxococcota bacterium]|nr:hypothetical protein [Myxococcota bacterium]